MARVWRTLVVCLSLTAFLAANTPFVHALSSAWPCACAGEDLDPAATACPCPACAAHSGTAPSGSAQVAEEAVPSSDCPACPSCPCCPFPGGCAFCSVAKVPGMVAAMPVPSPTPAQEQVQLLAAPRLPSTYCGKLIRPPRS